MRLLNVDTLTFTNFHSAPFPKYAIASHRWSEGSEASLQDVQERKGTDKAGYRKIIGFVDFMKAHMPLVRWLWIDTCCIDQSSSSEVSDAINAMFKWYKGAQVCLAWLDDVATAADLASFQISVWFTRGWTLQELLAPGVVLFLSRDWQVIGHKGHSERIATPTGPSLEESIAFITNIPETVLHDYDRGQDLSVEAKMHWMTDRETTREEDMSYCLLGILNVDMNIRYNIGRERAAARLMEKVRKDQGRLASTTPDEYRVQFDLKGIPLTDHFVQRETDMGYLTSFFITAAPTAAQRQRVFVLYGMGGIGKTQLCAEFARMYQNHFSAIFWLNGSSKDDLRKAMAEAALRLPSADTTRGRETSVEPENTAQLEQSFCRWLSLSNNKDWLLIIDNVDREWQSEEPDPQAFDYHDFLPSADHGDIIITTRLKRLGRPQASLGLGKVNDDVAREIIETRAGMAVKDIEPLIAKLGGLPLALVQAGAYLGATGITTADYLRSYDDTWEELMQYQNQFPLQEYAQRSVLTTWKMSYEQVKSIDAQAATLLDLWAFLDQDDIWLDLILAPKHKLKQTESIVDETFPRATRLSLQHSIGVLAQFSTITISSTGGSPSIAPVLHDWCLHHIGASRQKLLGVAMRLVANTAYDFVHGLPGLHPPKGSFLRLFAHAKAVGRKVQILSEGEADPEVCSMIADFLCAWPGSNEAEKLYLRAIQGFESGWDSSKRSSFSRNHHDLSRLWRRFEYTSADKLAFVYLQQGKHEKAELMSQRAVCGYRNLLGSENRSTLRVVGTLGFIQYLMDKPEAEGTLLQAFQGFERTSGTEDISALDVLDNLGMIYNDQGRQKDAEQMLTQAVRVSEKVLGPDNLKTLNPVHNLAVQYLQQGKHREAKELFLRALQGKERMLGPENPTTLTTVLSLGHVCKYEKKLEQAEEMYIRVVRGFEKALGPEHPATLEVLSILANLYADQGKTQEAEEMQKRVFRGFEKFWGPEHKFTLFSLGRLGIVMISQGREAEGAGMVSRAVQGLQKLPEPPKQEISFLEEAMTSLRKQRLLPKTPEQDSPVHINPTEGRK